MQYYSVRPVIERGFPFNFIIGGRGIGKTYSSLEYVMEKDVRHAYIRRQANEIELCANKEVNPYKELNFQKNKQYTIEKHKDFSLIKEQKNLKGYAFALSTFANIRGADFTDLELGIFDEFVPQKEKRSVIKNEADAVFNLYETINRNRELQGRKPFMLLFLSNAVSIASPLMRELGLIPVLEMMIRKNQARYTDPERGVYIELPKDLEITESKKATALYRLTKDTRFYEHALSNKFAYDSYYNIKKKNLMEYTPLCAVLDIFIYQHKSNGELYASCIRADCPIYTEDTLSLFRRNHWFVVREYYVCGKLFFDSFQTKTIIEEVLK